MVLQQFIPRIKAEPIIVNLQRILQPVTDFIRGNPIVSTAIVGAGTTGLVAAVAVARRARVSRRKKRKVSKKKAVTRRKRKAKRRKVKRKVSHRSPRHKGHKRVAFTTADGKKVSFLVRKKGSKSHRRKKRK